MRQNAFQFITFDSAPGLGIAGVQIQPMLSRQEAHHLVHVGPQLVGRARFSRICSGRHYAAAGQTVAGLEAPHVIALPAMQRYRDLRQPLGRLVTVDAQLGVTLSGRFIRFLDPLRIAHTESSLRVLKI
jgi:hypothetical protein